MKDFIAPITASLMIFGGGAFLYLTLSAEGARVEPTHMAIVGLMGAAVQYLFGADIQKRTTDSQPTVTTTTGPPATLTMTPAERASYDAGDIPAEPYGSTRT